MNMERKTGLMNKKYVSPCFLPGMRLGNIMFTLAAACAHARTVGVECRVPWAYNDASLMLRSRLGGWVLPSTPCGTNEPPSWQEPSFAYCPVPSRIRTGGLRGYFQSARYFEGQEAFIRALFAPLTAEKEPGAVGIHIRLGDYRRLRDKHRILDPGFLRRAAGHLSPGKNRLVLFSDEPDEAAEMLARVPAFGRFALEIDRGAPCESLRRMTAMEELVMSCSSFSWWGAWLGNTRKVIVPRDWFVGGVEDYRDIYLPHWVTL